MKIAIGAAVLILISLSKNAESKELFEFETEYNKNIPPSKDMAVSISLFINRISVVDESKEEISLDVFLQIYWEDARIRILDNSSEALELTWDKENKFWVPDLYIRQLKEMKVLSLFQQMASIRIYRNSTIRVSIGTTVVIKCDMDFRLYPLDVQTCAIDFSSYKYTISNMKFRWRDDPPLSFPGDFGDGCRLPRYVVSFATQPDEHVVYYGEGNHSAARMVITMSRELRSHLLESYLPSTLFVIMSWGSFIIMPEIVPGRMVLLVTTLLSLVTMFDTVRNNSPNALELKCIEVWLISCTLFVFLALLEYFVVLFGMRYDKHWRHKKQEFDVPSMINRNLNNNNNHHGNNVSLFGTQRVAPEHKVEQVVTDVNRNVSIPIRITTLQNFCCHTLLLLVQCTQVNMKETQRRKTKLQLKLLTHHVILYCGSQRGTLDKVSLVLFPCCFVGFACAYWFSYLSESEKPIEL